MPTRRLPWIVLAALFLVGAALPAARAGGVVVAKFGDKSKKRLGPKAQQALMQALAERGLELRPWADYQRTAKRKRISNRNMWKPGSVRSLCKALELDGVVVGTVSRSRGRYAIQLRLLGSQGQLLWQETYRERRAAFPAGKAGHAADRIAEKLGGPGEARPEPAPEEAPVADGSPALEEAPVAGGTRPAVEPAPAVKPAPEEGMPDWARDDQPAERKSEPPAAEARGRAGEEEPPEGGALPVHDALVAVGASLNLRSGLKPTHSASVFPGLRIDGLLFLDAFLDEGFARGLGVYLDLDFSLGLEYGYRSASERWPAQQIQGRGGLAYRFDFDVTTRPTLLIKIGFGGTSCSIDTDLAQVASARYLAPEIGLSAGIFLWEPYLRLGLGFAFLVPVIAGDEIGGTGWGWSLDAGVDAALAGFLHVGLGYAVAMMLLDEDTMGEVTDTYQGFFLRVGYAYD